MSGNAVKIKIDARKFSALLARVPGSMRKATALGLEQIGQGSERDLVKRTRGRPGVQTRTGLLRKGIGHAVAAEDKAQFVTSFVAGVKYANLQEHGGTVVPKNRKWLTIPVGPALTASGVARGPARSFPGLKFILGKKPGTAFLVMPPAKTKSGKLRKGQDARGTIYFVLKKKVVVPGRLGFVATWRDWIVKNAARVMLGNLRAAVAKLNKGGA